MKKALITLALLAVLGTMTPEAEQIETPKPQPEQAATLPAPTDYDPTAAEWITADNDPNPEAHRVGDTDIFQYCRVDGSRFMICEDRLYQIPAEMTAEEAAALIIEDNARTLANNRK